MAPDPAIAATAGLARVAPRSGAPHCAAEEPAADAFRLSEIISALSYALDLTEGQPMGHSARTCVIGMRLAALLRLDPDQRLPLFYALLLKDAGCSSNAARMASLFGADDIALKRDVKLVDHTSRLAGAGYTLRHAGGGGNPLAWVRRVATIGSRSDAIGRELTQVRCDRGADIVRMIGMPPATAEAIRHLDEHWDGGGQPAGVAGAAIPLLGRILCLTQTFEVFASARGLNPAYAMASRRSGSWFDPELVRALATLRGDSAFWHGLATGDPIELVAPHEPEDQIITADESRVDLVAEAFAKVIDAKSPYTYRHSEGVAAIAVDIGAALGFGAHELRDLRRAALLHDIGKLGVSNAILDKPGKLSDEEWAIMRRHTAHTFEVLSRVGRFRSLAEVAASHHERLDGTGYHRGLSGEALSRPARVLAAADITEALSADRPYRAGLDWDEVIGTIGKLAGPGICPECFDVLRAGPARRPLGPGDGRGTGAPHPG